MSILFGYYFDNRGKMIRSSVWEIITYFNAVCDRKAQRKYYQFFLISTILSVLLKKD